ncbi:MAG: mitochondrial 37S ribosomal protein nam9 [Phylliscum demangeonii]|nr:MAG: mitochondrial 37S ribosomal protein nam9 [Phylliscum demangeonii]
MRMRTRFHGLKRPKIRQTWNKYNFYNLARATRQVVEAQTFYKQKWAAKSITRNYHGEHIREKKWERMFRPRMAAVVPMNHAYLARHDGSEQAAGRGSGEDVREAKKAVARTPYLHMVYAPMERRLDTAVFRALFASSARQARQMVVHGAVHVNGKKMIHPSYLLNPGDMFQVEPERVLFATGAGKDKSQRKAARQLRRKAAKKAASPAEDQPAADSTPGEPVEAAGETEAATEPTDDRLERLTSLLARARALLTTGKQELSAKRKRDLRAFQQEARRTMSRAGGKKATDRTALVNAQLDDLLAKFSGAPTPSAAPESDSSSASESSDPTAGLSKEDKRALEQALQDARDNPIDSTRPYATPWRPRDYMCAFAFIPRYLEVNQKICSAVYLRHPVARPGLAEVPAPFGADTYQLAHAWYLRRR